MKTYQDRVSKITCEADIDKQMELAKQAMFRSRRDFKKAETLQQKLDASKIVKHHEGVLRQLRINRFDLEDKINSAT